MDIFSMNLENPEAEAIEEAAGYLRKGRAIVFPTDTVYGLGVNALRVDSIERLFKIKQRPPSKPVPLIVKDIAMAKQLAYFDSKKEKILNTVWPGAITVVLSKRDTVPDSLTANQPTVGLRIPDCQFTSDLMEQVDFPVTATSANISGQDPLGDSKAVIMAFEKEYLRPELVLDAGQLPNNPPSTVLDLTTNQPRILRIGAVDKQKLLEILGL